MDGRVGVEPGDAGVELLPGSRRPAGARGPRRCPPRRSPRASWPRSARSARRRPPGSVPRPDGDPGAAQPRHPVGHLGPHPAASSSPSSRMAVIGTSVCHCRTLAARPRRPRRRRRWRPGPVAAQCRKWRSPRHDHRDPRLVGRGDHLVVPDGAARLDHGGHPGVGQDLQAVGEGEEGVARPPRRPRPARPAFCTAISAATTRDCWPAPTPTAWPSVTTAMALEVVRAHTRQASARSRHSASVGRRSVATSPRRRVDQEAGRRPGPARWSPRLRSWRTSASGAGRRQQPGGLAPAVSWSSASAS